MIPQTFEQWKICLVKDCKIHLTREFAKSRLLVYSDNNLPETQNFIRLYGLQHHQNIIGWYKKIVDEGLENDSKLIR